MAWCWRYRRRAMARACNVDAAALVAAEAEAQIALDAQQPAVDAEDLESADRRRGRSAWFRSFWLGQVISVLITGTGIFSTELSEKEIQVPLMQCSLNYVLLCGFLLLMMPAIYRNGLGAPVWQYIFWALADVEANYLVVKAYQYTSITSVMLLDCFAIPASMVISCVLLKAKYEVWHILACLVCVVGLCLTVLSDLMSGRAAAASGAGPSWLGDFFVIAGATLYGISNVFQEKLLAGGTRRREALGMLGLFGTLITFVQASILERQAFEKIHWDLSTASQFLGFETCLFFMYCFTSVFLSHADAAVFNLSMLTSDMYSVLYAWYVQHQKPTWMYGLAFITTISGLVLYYSKPMPTEASRPRELSHDSCSNSILARA